MVRTTRSVASPARGIPSLDGLRAASVMLVVIAHGVAVRQVVAWRDNAPALAGVFAGLEEIGTFGVRVFFVLSGYLITTLLLKEIERSGSIHLGHFYFRRTLRIFPPYYAYLAVLAAALSAGLVAAGTEAGFRWWPAIVYASNAFQVHWGPLKHTWSLSVEEQFYLIWPLALISLGKQNARTAAACLLVTAPIVRAATFAATGNIHVSGFYAFDGLAIGALMAFFEPTWRTSPRWRMSLAHPLARAFSLGALILGAFAARFAWLDLADQFFLQSLDVVAIASLVMSCVLWPNKGVARFLNTRTMRAIGIASYSIYLVQQPFLLTAGPFDTLQAALAAVVLAAAASYFLIERPSLALRGWLERRWLRENLPHEMARRRAHNATDPGR